MMVVDVPILIVIAVLGKVVWYCEVNGLIKIIPPYIEKEIEPPKGGIERYKPTIKAILP